MHCIKLLPILMISLPCAILGQNRGKDGKFKVYDVNYKIEIPVAIIGAVGAGVGFSQLNGLTKLTEREVLGLNPNSINRFDRPVLSYSASGYNQARNTSDWILGSTGILPGLLLLDPEIRHDWKDLVTLYIEAHTLSSGTYLASSFTFRRARPLAYNSVLPLSQRSGGNTSNAFFSGHTSTTATASFFMAKVYCDYHHLNSKQKIAIYTLAAVPPAVVGHYRTKAGKHFRTDVLMGLGIGMASGILVPQWHKKRKNKALTYVPIHHRNVKGIRLGYRF